MGILNGSFNATRYIITELKGSAPTFSNGTKFNPMSHGQRIDHSIGWAPIKYGISPSHELSMGTWVFQVYFDKIKPNRIRVKDMAAAMLQGHLNNGDLITKSLLASIEKDAYDEIYRDTSPTTWAVDVAITQGMLFIGATSDNKVGAIIGLLREMGISVGGSAPWDIEEMEPIQKTQLKKGNPLGSRLLYHLIDQDDTAMEAEHGSARVMLPSAGAASFSGPVAVDVQSAVNDGAELVSCKLAIVSGEAADGYDVYNVSINGPAYTMSVALSKGEGDTWQEKLLSRLDIVLSAWAWLDARAAKLLGGTNGTVDPTLRAVNDALEAMENGDDRATHTAMARVSRATHAAIVRAGRDDTDPRPRRVTEHVFRHSTAQPGGGE